MGGTTNLSTQEKLDRIVKIVAVETYSEVCSIYGRNNENVLILLATEGLNPLAVHFTRMSVGEGVIGDVAANARPLVVSNVKNHPNFLYQAETGEDPLNGFLGVPIFRSGKVLGVIAIQTKNIRLYDSCEIELLQTVAMILGEIIVSSDFLPMDQLRQHEQISWLPASLSGLSLNTGISKGIAIFHQVFPL